MPNRQLFTDRLMELPPDQRAKLTDIIKRQLHGIATTPTMPQVQNNGAFQAPIPIMPQPSRTPLKPKMIVTENGDIDEEELIKLLAALPTAFPT
jgi:hypothetical protein